MKNVCKGQSKYRTGEKSFKRIATSCYSCTPWSRPLPSANYSVTSRQEEAGGARCPGTVTMSLSHRFRHSADVGVTFLTRLCDFILCTHRQVTSRGQRTRGHVKYVIVVSGAPHFPYLGFVFLMPDLSSKSASRVEKQKICADGRSPGGLGTHLEKSQSSVETPFVCVLNLGDNRDKVEIILLLLGIAIRTIGHSSKGMRCLKDTPFILH